MEDFSRFTMNDLNDFLIGSKFGDGCFVKKTNQHNTYAVFSHCEKQYDYLKWKYYFLKNFWLLRPDKTIKEKKLIGCYENAQRQFYFSTSSNIHLNYYYESSIKELIESMNKLGLLIFTLDDGSFEQCTCKISSAKFSEEEEDLFCEYINDIFKLDAYIYRNINPSKNYFRINKNGLLKIIDWTHEIFGDILDSKIIKTRKCA